MYIKEIKDNDVDMGRNGRPREEAGSCSDEMSEMSDRCKKKQRGETMSNIMNRREGLLGYTPHVVTF